MHACSILAGSTTCISLYRHEVRALNRARDRAIVVRTHESVLPRVVALFSFIFSTGFDGSHDILAYPEIMVWLRRMRPRVSGMPPLVSPAVRKLGLLAKRFDRAFMVCGSFWIPGGAP